MIYPDSFENKIGFDIIRQKINNLCVSSLGKASASNICFSYNFTDISRNLNEAEEARKAILFLSSFPLDEFPDCTKEIIRLKTEGTIVELEKLQEIASSVEIFYNCYQYFEKNKNELPLLHKIMFNDNASGKILKLIFNIIDEKGIIRDNASDNLLIIRKKLNTEESRINKQLNIILKNIRSEGIVKEDCEATIRNGRLVIPVPAGNKNKVKGFIQDTSSTGQTFFIEPTEIFNINNNIRELQSEEKQEIYKILRHLTEDLRPFLVNIEKILHTLSYIDVLQAKAKFAIEINAVKPLVTNKPIIEWKNAIHPLLFLSFKNQQRKVVPLSININDDNRIIVISGPNAGGKSIALKTVALLQYMLQCGLLIPVSENSESGLFNNVFIDIGDEQSIENDLSTYTSHLKNIKLFIEEANEQTLILLDEIGTGTEPHLGSIIAEECLLTLCNLKAKGVITTHFANLKKITQETDGLQNAAMLFDTENLKPLYEISIGNPGSSYTFEIAKRVGFPEDILGKAAKKTQSSQLNFEQQLQELILDRKKLNKERLEIAATDKILSEVIEKYSNLLKELELQKKEIIKEAKSQAQEIVDGANKIIENTIQEIRKSQADKEKTKKIRENLKKISKEEIIHPKSILDTHTMQLPFKIPQNENIDTKKIFFQKGNIVKTSANNAIGEILEIKGNKAKVNFSGDTSIWINIKDLVSFDGDKTERIRIIKNNVGTIVHDLSQRVSNFSISIDVRGKRADEALEIIKKYVDEAIMLHISFFKILHGKGNGILRSVIRDYLKTISEISFISDENIEHGGSGITVVELK